jgi:hypothetical protein
VHGIQTKVMNFFYSSMHLYKFRSTYSNSLPVLKGRLMGLKFWGSLESVPVFDKVSTFLCVLPNLRMYDSRIHGLIEYMRSVRHSFTLLPIPQVLVYSALLVKHLIHGVFSFRMRWDLELWPLSVSRGFCHAGHGNVNWLLKKSEQRWLSLTDAI